MKRRVRKEDVIRTTWQLITRHGIRAVRVDEIAQCLGMSKRTLYELFPDKTNLIAACLEQTSRQQKEKITQLREVYSGDPLQKLFRIIGKYLGDIYLVDCEFLSDMKEKSDFIVSLPMKGRINSLNASVACGVLCYEIARQRAGIKAKG